MSDNDKPMPAAFFAKLFDVTDRYIRKLAQDGHIPKMGNDQYPMIGTIKGYVKFLQERINSNHKNPERLAEERTRLTKGQADKIELEVLILERELIHRSEIEQAWFDIAVSIKSKMLSLPTKLAAQLKAISDETMIEKIIKSHVTTALEELANFEIQRDSLPHTSKNVSPVLAAAESDSQ